MASIYRRPTSKIWQCAFYVPAPDGGAKQVRKSTGKRSRKEAERVAVELERAARSTEGVSDDHQRKIHHLIACAGEDALRDRLNVSRARAYLSQILQLTTGEDLTTFTVASWSREWLSRKRSSVGTSTIARYESNVREFLAWLGDSAEKPLESVTSNHIREFRTHLQQTGRTARTVNAYIKDVGSIYRSAIREGLVSSNPATTLEPLPLNDSQERLPFTQGEVSRLIEAAPSADWKGLILLAAYSGLRLRDCARIRWANVDLAEGCLLVTPEKTKQKRVKVKIPMHQGLLLFLEFHPIADDPQAFVFPSLADRNVGGKCGLSLTFTRIMEAGNVSRGQVRGGARKSYERGFHSLRHSFTSWLANAGVSAELRQAMTGHLDSESHKLYTHHDPASLRNAVERLPWLEANSAARNQTERATT